MRKRVIVAAAVAAATVLAVLIPLRLSQDAAGPVCVVEPSTFPAAGIAGWRGEQLDNAAIIMRNVASLGFGSDEQILGMMTAMGESSLRNINYGDRETRGVTNPEGTRTTSIGLFQQQEWWGSVEERMGPAAALFSVRLERIPDWTRPEPSHVINHVQVNTDRGYYTRSLADATAVVDGLGGSF